MAKYRKKPRTFGKTAKQWQRLYDEYKSYLKYKSGITKLTKTEFKEAWTNREKGTSIYDLVTQTRKADKYSQYKRVYERFENKGIQLSDIYSEKAFYAQLNDYSSIESFVKGQQFVTDKQALVWSEHAKMIGLNVSRNDFLSENEKSQSFWDTIEALGGWEVVYEYV